MNLTETEIEAELAAHGMEEVHFSHRKAFKIGAEYERRQVFKELQLRFPDVIYRIKAGMSKEAWLIFSGEMEVQRSEKNKGEEKQCRPQISQK
ncbi:hypothetical protein LCGC14_2922170 [marine sediment metagenome]|uniref:Uncharacterized protein n=1 Tax=marine sediment metagenome TaxID=412755 RepID=A0A0F8XNR9_9ZZZZ